MKIVTYNILNDHPSFADLPKKNWANRKTYLLEQVQRLQPDVLAIQEGGTNQIEDLLEVLPNFDYYGPQAGGIRGGEQVGIFYRQEAIKLLDKGRFWLSQTPTVCSKDWGAKHYRICTWMQLKEQITGAVLFHFNTHLDHQNDDIRAQQLQVILEKIEAFKQAHPQAAFVLTGDFNAGAGTSVYQNVVKNSGLKDAFHQAKRKKKKPSYSFVGMDKAWTWTKLLLHLFYPKYMHKRLDHIFVSPKIEVLYYEINNWSYGKLYPSDHLPILIEIGRLS